MSDDRDPSADADLRRVGAGVVDLVAPVVEQLERLSTLIPTMSLGEAAAQRRLSATDAAAVRSWVVAAFARHPMLVGAGLAVSQADGGAEAIAWMVRDGDAVVQKHHVRNPESDSYYDFTQARWFRLAASATGPVLVGPYVDSWGTDDYTMTVSQRAESVSGTTVVLAADIDPRSLMTAVERLLASHDSMTLLDSEDRVIVSARSDLETGTRLAAVRHWRVDRRISLPQLNWSVVDLGRSGADESS